MIECHNCGSLNDDEVCSSCGLELSHKVILEYDDDPKVIIRKITKPLILGKGLFIMGSFGSMVVMMTSIYIGIITFINSKRTRGVAIHPLNITFARFKK